MCNKGDGLSPDIRCRYAGTEVNRENDLAYYASTPPPESMRLLVANIAMKRTRGDQPLVPSFSDATNAYVNAKPTRGVFIRAPKELGLPPNAFGRLRRCAYGTRDAGALSEEHYARVLSSTGFKRGTAAHVFPPSKMGCVRGGSRRRVRRLGHQRHAHPL